MWRPAGVQPSAEAADLLATVAALNLRLNDLVGQMRDLNRMVTELFHDHEERERVRAHSRERGGAT